MAKYRLRLWLGLWAIFGWTLWAEWASAQTYAIVVSESTVSDPAWNEVVETLASKHTAASRTIQCITWKTNVEESLDSLRKTFPKWICFVATPTEATGGFVRRVHRMTRTLDDDPYTDSYWGILTGYSAESALRIAKQSEPLVIRRAASGTSFALQRCEEGVWYSETTQNEIATKDRGAEPVVTQDGPDDTTRVLAESLTTADLFITSGHATQRDWQIGFTYRNGQFRCKDGRLYGLNTANEEIPIEAPNPKVYLAIGNCLMGDIDGPDAMALAWLNNAGVDQMVGYTVPTWYGYGGWGILDYFIEQPGRFSLTESFYANNQAIIYRLETYFPGLLEQLRQAEQSAERTGDGRISLQIPLHETAKSAGLTPQDGVGLLYDLETVAFYGDPAWDARLAAQPQSWDQNLTVEPISIEPGIEKTEEMGGDVYTLEIVPNQGDASFAPINTNGSQRGGRPIFVPFPNRINAASVEITEGSERSPVITDRFMILAQPDPKSKEKPIRIRFTATLAR